MLKICALQLLFCVGLAFCEVDRLIILFTNATGDVYSTYFSSLEPSVYLPCYENREK
jgi:hypothetical protein